MHFLKKWYFLLSERKVMRVRDKLKRKAHISDMFVKRHLRSIATIN